MAALAVVDCGSGSSRLSIYSLHGSDGLVHEDRYVPSNILPTLVPAIIKEQHGMWCDKLVEILASEQSMPHVVVGTTGGLRKAIAQGSVTEAQVQKFADTLTSRLQGRARLAQLSGDEEAELELAAVRYIASHALGTTRPSFGGGIQRIASETGVLSCGVSSSQIAYCPHLQETSSAFRPGEQQPPLSKFLSINTNLLDAIAAAREFGHETWKGAAFAYTEDLMWKRTAEVGAPIGKLRGTFVVIELAGSIGKEAGLADRLVPKREAVQLLTQHLESMQRIAGKDLKIRLSEYQDGKPSHSPQSISFFQEARIPLLIITLALLDLFSSRSFFYFATSFQVGANNTLRTQWPLGLFLKERGLDKERSKL